MVGISSASRFEAPELLQLGAPPKLATKPYETILSAAMADMIARYVAAGINYDVQNLEFDTSVIHVESDSYRDYLRRQDIDSIVAQTYLGGARGAMLDQRAADYGVVRKVLVPADPVTGAAAIMEGDESLRYRARLSWEALSVAGPPGAYVFHAKNAHPYVYDVLAIGPETGIVEPGEVLIVVQSINNDGVPTVGIMDAVADKLDAYEVIYSDATSVIRPVRNLQAVRPLGSRVTVHAASALYYTTTATLYVDAYGDPEKIRLEALERLNAYQASVQRTGETVFVSGRIAALSLADENGVPVVDDVVITGGNVVPTHLQIPVPLAPVLNIVVR